MSLRRTGSCRHGPRPVSSRRSSESSMYTVDEDDRRSSSSSSSSRLAELSWSIPTTPPCLKTTFHSSTCASYEGNYSIISSGDEPDLQRKPHIRRARRHKTPRLRPLPPLPQHLNRPSLSLNIPPPLRPSPPPPPPPPPPHIQVSRLRQLPVPPLPMSAFPTIPPTACSTPATHLPPPIEYPRFEDEIDWGMIDEILASHN